MKDETAARLLRRAISSERRELLRALVIGEAIDERAEARRYALPPEAETQISEEAAEDRDG